MDDLNKGIIEVEFLNCGATAIDVESLAAGKNKENEEAPTLDDSGLCGKDFPKNKLLLQVLAHLFFLMVFIRTKII